MKFKRIDINKYRTEEVTNIYSREGIFSDGRTYLVECWAEYGCTMLTIFIQSIGFKVFEEWDKDLHLEEIPDDIQSYLENEGYDHDFFSNGISFRCYGEEDKLLSINIIVGIDE